jgi:hypothetical protein
MQGTLARGDLRVARDMQQIGDLVHQGALEAVDLVVG